jgi:hypothetical protein
MECEHGQAQNADEVTRTVSILLDLETRLFGRPIDMLITNLTYD